MRLPQGLRHLRVLLLEIIKFFCRNQIINVLIPLIKFLDLFEQEAMFATVLPRSRTVPTMIITIIDGFNGVFKDSPRGNGGVRFMAPLSPACAAARTCFSQYRIVLIDTPCFVAAATGVNSWRRIAATICSFSSSAYRW